jgi:hypothetical protein
VCSVGNGKRWLQCGAGESDIELTLTFGGLAFQHEHETLRMKTVMWWFMLVFDCLWALPLSLSSGDELSNSSWETREGETSHNQGLTHIDALMSLAGFELSSRVLTGSAIPARLTYQKGLARLAWLTARLNCCSAMALKPEPAAEALVRVSEYDSKTAAN